jgi:HAD superfamily hydrolase (TIGR01549 family)
VAESEPTAPAGIEQDQLKAVFFDVGGTLWDSNACALHVMEIVLPAAAPLLPQGETAEVIRRFNAVFLDLPRKHHVRDRRPFSTLRRFEALLDSYDVKKRGLALQLSRKYDAARRFVMRQFLRRDALQVLRALGRRGLQRGVIMNGAPAVQRNMLGTLALAAELEHVILAEIEGYSKPDVRLFRRALELAGVEPHQMIYVGDSPLTDVLGAARAGIPAVWFNTGRRRLPKGFPAPDFTITRLSEVLDILEA